MSRLWEIVQAHLDEYGVRSAALARRMDTRPQTLDSWKNRGLRKLPEKRLLLALARETRTPYRDVLDAVLHDIGYLPEKELMEHDRSAPITEAPDGAAQRIGKVEPGAQVGRVAGSSPHPSPAKNVEEKSRRAQGLPTNLRLT